MDSYRDWNALRRLHSVALRGLCVDSPPVVFCFCPYSHMVWAGWWTTPPRATYAWMGPEHTTKDLGIPKSHLASGGLAFVQRSPDEVVTAMARWGLERTIELGAVLNVTVHHSTPKNSLADEIVLAGGAFISRSAIPRPLLPTARYYSVTRTDIIAPAPNWLNPIQSSVQRANLWFGTAMMSTVFMFTRGWLVATAVTLPVAAFPIAAVIGAANLHYLNVAIWAVFAAAAVVIKDGVWATSQLAYQVTGSPSMQTLALVVMMYLLSVCGISSAMGMILLFPRWFWATMRMCTSWSRTMANAIVPPPTIAQIPRSSVSIPDRAAFLGRRPTR